MHKLSKTPIAPVYLAVELRGDRFDSNAVHHYQPERPKGDTFELPARPGLADVTVFVDFGRVVPGTVEIEADAPTGTEIKPHPGNLAWARGKVATPHGPIAVEWRQQGKQLVVRHDLPSGMIVLESAGSDCQ